MEWKTINEAEPTPGRLYVVFTDTGSYRVAQYAVGTIETYRMTRLYDKEDAICPKKAFRAPGGSCGIVIKNVKYFAEIPELPELNEIDKLRLKLFEAERHVAELKSQLKDKQDEQQR